MESEERMRDRSWNLAKVGPAGAALLCALALFATGAFASTANARIKRVWYTAGPGETNGLTISLSGPNYVLSDPTATVTGEPDCTASAHTATCPVEGIIGITVNVGDGNDTVRNTTSTPSTLSGGDGRDLLEGGPGNDTLRGNREVDTHNGGGGDDFIDSRGDQGDIVNCGSGNDTVRADPADRIAADCEIVDRGPVPPSPPPPASGPSPAVRALLGSDESRKLKPGACTTDKRGTPADDRLSGTTLGDSIFGLQGNDILEGLQSDDCLFGGAGSDRLSGEEGDDRLLGDDTNKNRGNDRLVGNAGDDLLVGRSGRDRLSGGAGNDRLSGGRGNDRLTAGPGRNRLLGGPGSDLLNSVNGRVDRLNCGSGRDIARADRRDRVRGCERVRRRRR
jgi:Ca2+-binding RTX toxin-like protein